MKQIVHIKMFPLICMKARLILNILWIYHLLKMCALDMKRLFVFTKKSLMFLSKPFCQKHKYVFLKWAKNNLVECDIYSWGQDCNSSCSDNCADQGYCSNVNGICSQGCKPGYQDNLCTQGMYELHIHITWPGIPEIGTRFKFIVNFVYN